MRKEPLAFGSRWAGCGLFLLLLSSGYTQAQIREERRTTTTTTEVRGVSAVIGASVRLTGAESFGKVEDIIINDQGCIDFVVVVAEEKFFAVPFTLARINFAEKVVSFDIDRELFLRAPSFTRGRFPDFSVNSEFVKQVNSHFRSAGGERRDRGREAAPRDSRPPDRKPPDTRPSDRRPPDDRRPSDDRRPPDDRKPPMKDKDQRPIKDKERDQKDKSGG